MQKQAKDIRVLVVDDSALVREMIRAILESETGIEVVGEAADGIEAIARVAELRPDIVTMDIEMPIMGGLEAIERIIAENPVPILAVTALTGVRTAFAAVSKGALDVIEKPDISPQNMQKLIQKIRVLSRVDVAAHLTALGRRNGPAPAGKPVLSRVTGRRTVAIAASTGGPQAINHILSRLPADFAAPIVITQHMAEGFTRGMVDWLDGTTPLTVVVAAHGELLRPGHVYVNPAEHSMRITMQGMIILGESEPRLLYRPSCNTLLDSVAAAYGQRAIGVILSGMGDDGVLGMQAIKKAGGATLAQDAKSSVIFGMNKLAAEAGCIDRLLPLSEIPAELLIRAGGQ
jgi:two-component system, chemotaxis family, protein-glutamate methylesterase/glutaminase